MRRVGILLYVLLIASCADRCNRRAAAPPDVAVDPALERTPPIATQVTMQLLEEGPKGRVLVEARFEPGAIQGRFHAVQLSGGKVVLRDDGKQGDVAADDGIFSAQLEEDVDTLSKTLEQASRLTAEGAAARPRFEGRQLIRADRRAIAAIDIRGFLDRKKILLPPTFFCELLLDVSIPHSLMITDLGVVEDPTRTNNPCVAGASAARAWTFGKLMTDMANTTATGVSAEDFVKGWLQSWLAPASVNSDDLTARTAMFDRVIRPWVVRSGSPAGSFSITDWQTKPLNLDLAPFKLLAIVNRLDLRGNLGYGFANPGEGRFVFGVVDPISCAPFPFTVIFEYGIPIRSCAGLKAYAQKWYDLKSLAIGSPAYNTALQEITDVFATANADPSRPNGSALNQIRTNEIAVGSPWELREFNIDGTSHQLFLTTVKQEPAKKYNARALPAGAAADVTLMADWVNANAADVVADRHSVPAALSGGQPFLGGKAHTESPGHFWDAAPLQIANDDARHHFSLNTCSGCHGGETRTVFLHVGTASFGSVAPLSGFLTGITVPDPAGRPTGSPASRTFSDLARRQGSLEGLLCTKCTLRVFELHEALTFKPIAMTH